MNGRISFTYGFTNSSEKGAHRIKNESRFETLTTQARSEAPPCVDVASRVIAILSAEYVQFERVSDRPLMWLAAFSSAVVTPLLVLAIVVYNTWT